MSLITTPISFEMAANSWRSRSTTSKLISIIRSLAALSILFATWLSYFGIGGVTALAVKRIQLLDYGSALQYFLSIVLILLISDFVGGIIAVFQGMRRGGVSWEDKLRSIGLIKIVLG
jgi:hypothetical protein